MLCLQILCFVCSVDLISDLGFIRKQIFGFWNFVEQFRGIIMNLLYGTNFKFSNDEMKKYPDLMDLDSTNSHHYQQETHNTLFSSLDDGTEGLHSSNNGGGGGGDGSEDYRFMRSLSPEAEFIVSRFMASCIGNFDSGSGERAVKQETVDLIQQQNGFCNQSSSMVNTSLVNSSGGAQIGNSFGVMNSSNFDNSMQLQLGARNSSNLFRQSSSPAAFFSHLNSENGNICSFLQFGFCRLEILDTLIGQNLSTAIFVKFLAPNLNMFLEMESFLFPFCEKMDCFIFC